MTVVDWSDFHPDIAVSMLLADQRQHGGLDGVIPRLSGEFCGHVSALMHSVSGTLHRIHTLLCGVRCRPCRSLLAVGGPSFFPTTSFMLSEHCFCSCTAG